MSELKLRPPEEQSALLHSPLADTEKTRYMLPTGEYVRGKDAKTLSGAKNGFHFNAQEYLIANAQTPKEAGPPPLLPSFMRPRAQAKAARK